MALGLSASDRLLVCGPLYHVGAFDLPGIAVLWMGGTWCLLREFSPAAVLDAIGRHRLTCAWLAPVMLHMCLGFEDRDRHDLGSMRWVIGGGEKTPEARIRAFGTLFPNARYIDGYGLTESCSGDTLMEPGRELEKIGSVGRPLAHVRVEIRDDDGHPLPAGRTGEICLAGARITRGYWRDEDRTREAFHDDGWFRTGDVGHLDGDGFLYLTDRRKDMIISGGENIASSEVDGCFTSIRRSPRPQWSAGRTSAGASGRSRWLSRVRAPPSVPTTSSGTAAARLPGSRSRARSTWSDRCREIPRGRC